jgi:hypothetical protein
VYPAVQATQYVELVHVKQKTGHPDTQVELIKLYPKGHDVQKVRAVLLAQVTHGDVHDTH